MTTSDLPVHTFNVTGMTCGHCEQAVVRAVKLRLVSSYFLELHEAHPRIRSSVQLFCYGMPILVILTTAFGASLARLTGALI